MRGPVKELASACDLSGGCSWDESVGDVPTLDSRWCAQSDVDNSTITYRGDGRQAGRQALREGKNAR